MQIGLAVLKMWADKKWLHFRATLYKLEEQRLVDG